MQPLKITLIKKTMFSLSGIHHWLVELSDYPQISRYLFLARAAASGIKGLGTMVRVKGIEEKLTESFLW